MASDAPSPHDEMPTAEELSTSGREAIAPQIWVAGVVAVVIILLLLFGVVL